VKVILLTLADCAIQKAAQEYQPIRRSAIFQPRAEQFRSIVLIQGVRNPVIVSLLLLVALLSSVQVSTQCSQALLPRSTQAPLPAGESSSSSTVSANQQSSEVRTRTVDPKGKRNAITVPENTPLRVMNNQPISSRMTKPDTLLSFTVNQDVIIDGLLVIPCGAIVRGSIVNAQKAGMLTGSTQLEFELSALELGGQSYPLYTYQLKVAGASKTAPTKTKIKAGAIVGTITMAAGSIASNHTTVKAPGAAVTGAALGAGLGAAVAAASPAPIVSIPAESEMGFVLSSPVAVVPVDAKEAARLARGMKPGGPVLYIRDDTQ
jgi:hypothetical protein